MARPWAEDTVGNLQGAPAQAAPAEAAAGGSGSGGGGFLSNLNPMNWVGSLSAGTPPPPVSAGRDSTCPLLILSHFATELTAKRAHIRTKD